MVMPLMGLKFLGSYITIYMYLYPSKVLIDELQLIGFQHSFIMSVSIRR